MSFCKKMLLLITLSLPTLALSSFAGATQLTAERPGDEIYRTVLRKETSILNVPVEVSADQLAKVLNQVIANEIYKGSAAKISGLTVRIARNGPLTVRAADNYLHISIPIRTSFSYGFFSTQDIPLKITFKLSVGVSPDWKIITDIYYTGISDLLAEEISIGPLSIKPRSTIETVTRPLQQTLSEVISRSIAERFNVKSMIEKAWKAIYKPLLLDKNYRAWLQITPHEILLYPFYARNNQFKIAAGITTSAELIVGAEPISRIPAPLPALKLVKTYDKNFRIALAADLYYRDIVTIASPLLLNREFVSEGKSVLLKSFDVSGSGDRIIIKLETSGSLEGTLYLTGRPQFDPQTKMFSVVDVDFDIQTRDLLVKTADWFLHGTIRSTIQEKLNVNMEQKLKETQELLQKSISRIQLLEHVFLKGSISSLKISDVVVQKEKISIQVYSEGETGIEFE